MYNNETLRKGKFSPRNPEKYKGNPTNIIYRSGWELRVMKYLDGNPNILSWASEEIIIPYRSPIDRKMHRYFPDFWVKMKTKDGKIKQMVLELKPLKYTKPPDKPKKRTKRYINEMSTYLINEAKWDAAKEYCDKNGVEFRIITENDIG